MDYALRPCVLTLLIVYPPFLAAGIFFFRHVVRRHPHPDAARNKALKIVRFLMFAVCVPLGAVLSLAVLGWLDPLYNIVRGF